MEAFIMYAIADKVIYFYIFICIFLLIYNVIYIIQRTTQKQQKERRTERWKSLLQNQKTPFRKLRNLEELSAWHSALFAPDSPLPDAKRSAYLAQNRQALLSLSWDYARHDAMERAFFAYILRELFLTEPGGWNSFSGPLLSFLNHSTVYCRENVLKALYALGSPDPIGKAFDILSSNGWYHDPRLLSDGLMDYPGDKEDLVCYLWNNREKWQEQFGVAIVRFAAQVSSVFGKDFLRALKDERTPLEIRFALIRYFRGYPDPEAGSYLRTLFTEDSGEESTLAIAAASSLSAYPGSRTKNVLKRALSSRNWYVRRNAALSLKEIGITPEELDAIRHGRDRYASEMIDYITREGA